MHIPNLVFLYSLPNAFKHPSAFVQALCLTLALFSSPAQIHMFLINYVNKKNQEGGARIPGRPSGSLEICVNCEFDK